MDVILILTIYLLLTNIIGFFMMGIDKHKAKKRAFRIPEASLFTIAVIGGSLGTTLGMFTFRHKTRHWYFLYGMPAIFILQLILAFLLFYYAPIQFEIL